MTKSDSLDCLAFGPHPDDIELFCSGVLIKIKKQGFKTGIADLTRGELSTNGSQKQRREETENASRILGIDMRTNLEIEDGNISNSKENRLKIISVIRKWRPKIVLIPYFEDRHPDHENASKLLEQAIFYAGLKKIESEFDEFRPAGIVYYMMHTSFMPSFVVDISDEFDKKLESVKAYQSQFFLKQTGDSNTYINTPDFLTGVIHRAGYFGSQINVKFGEPFFLKKTLKIDNIVQIFS